MMFSERTRWPLDINSLTRLARLRRELGLPILDLTESNPTRCGFDYGSLIEAFRDPRILRYEPDPRGLASARNAIVEYYASHGIQIAPNQIFLTTSTSEAYSFIFRLLGNPGDEVLVPRPSYPLFEFLAGLNDLRLAPYPLAYDAGWRIDQSALHAAATPRACAVLWVHPNNPTGSYASREEAAFLAAFCAERGMALIADEVFFDYEHPGVCAPHASSFAAETRALTFTLNGLSKISALPQMKCAWMVVNGPDKLLAGALSKLEVITDTYLPVSAPVACALQKLLEIRHSIQPQILTRVTENLRRLDSLLTPDSAASRLRIEGGWYTILRLPRIRSDEEWALRLLDEDGVLIHPGHFYDFASEGHVVVSLLPTAEVFDEGMRRLIALVAKSA